MRAGFLVLAALLVALPGPRGALAQAQCSKADFEAVVDDAAGALRGLAQQNTPQFQAKLRQLKVKRGWTDDQLLKEAEPLVRDDRIAEFDERWAGLRLARRPARQHGGTGRHAEGQVDLHVRQNRAGTAEITQGLVPAARSE